jgi:hypothetical protein
MRLTALTLILLLLSSAGAAGAKPTPEPGGANQVNAVAATFGKPAFNGVVRLTPRELRDARASDGYIAMDGMKWIVFTATANNGTKRALDMQQFAASLVDANGESMAAQPDKVLPIGGVFGVAPGAGWKEQIAFLVPAGFVPVKILLLPAEPKRKAFRITIGAADYKAAPSAQPTG